MNNSALGARKIGKEEYPYKGVWPVAPTPFLDNGAVDDAGMKRVLDFLIDARVDGICILANFSEQFLISDAERAHLTRLCLEHVAGRVPVIVTISHFATSIVLERAKEAKQLGADMVMMMPPYHGALLKGSQEQIFEQFAAVGEVGLPIMLQDAPLSGVDLPVELLARMARDIEMLKLFKIECPRAADKIAALLECAGEYIEGPFDGEEGITLLADLDAGATGAMTSGMIPELIKVVVDDYLVGNTEQAATEYGRLLPAINHENRQCGWRSAKAAMVAGGIIQSDFCRHPIPPLAPRTKARLMAHLQPLDPLVLKWGV